MTNLTLNNWEFEADATNDRIIIRSLDTNEEYYLNEDGSTNIDALTIKGNDIDSNGDGVVDEADNTTTVKGNDIDSNGDGVVDEADNTTTVKGNDIDSNGDGTVDNADDADQVDGYDVQKNGSDTTGVINFKT